MKRLLLVTILTALAVSSLSGSEFKRHPIGKVYEATSNAVSVGTLDGTTDQIEFVLQVEQTSVITSVVLRYGARTGTPPTFRASIQGVDAAGNPDGLIKSSGAAFADFTPPADATWNGTIRVLTLGTSYSATAGEFISIVVSYQSGTIDATNKSTFGTNSGGLATTAFPYVTHNDGGVRTRQSFFPVIGYRTPSNGTFGLPIKDITEVQYSSDTVGADEYALRFMLHSDFGQSYAVSCVEAFVRTAAAGKTLKVALYDSSSAELRSVTLDTDMVMSTGSSSRLLRACFSSAATLSFGSVYRIGFIPQETASDFALKTFNFESPSDLSSLPGGTEFFLSTRADVGAWTDVTDKRPVAWIIVTDWTEPSGGGSSVKRIIGG